MAHPGILGDGMILGSIIRGVTIHLGGIARIIGAGVVGMPAIIVLGTIHGGVLHGAGGTMVIMVAFIRIIIIMLMLLLIIIGMTMAVLLTDGMVVPVDMQAAIA